MKKLLILGYSDFAKRVILPAVRRVPELSLVGIASKTGYREIPPTTQPYRSYEHAIESSGADTIYISLHNSAHKQWILFALNHGINVICDKPAFLASRDARTAARMAHKKHLFLVESLPFLYHRQHRELKKRIIRSKSKTLMITIQFGFPALPFKNFRNDPRLGGGCLADIGPYLVATGHYYIGTYPSRIFTTGRMNARGVIDQAMICMEFKDGGMLMGAIGFGRTYNAHLEVWSESLLADLHRPFSIRDNEPNIITLRKNNRHSQIAITPDSAMIHFLRRVARGDIRKTFPPSTIVSQAVALEAITRSFLLQRPVVPNYET